MEDDETMQEGKKTKREEVPAKAKTEVAPGKPATETPHVMKEAAASGTKEALVLDIPKEFYLLTRVQFAAIAGRLRDKLGLGLPWLAMSSGGSATAAPGGIPKEQPRVVMMMTKPDVPTGAIKVEMCDVNGSHGWKMCEEYMRPDGSYYWVCGPCEI